MLYTSPQNSKKGKKKLFFKIVKSNSGLWKQDKHLWLLEMCYMESSKSKSQPMLQREQTHETENENYWRVRKADWSSILAMTAAVDVPTEVTRGQLRFGVVTSHRLSPCSKRHQFTRLPCLETFTSPKLKSISIHFPEFSILHIILFFFTRNNWNAPEGPKLLTKSKRETMLLVQSIYH